MKAKPTPEILEMIALLARAAYAEQGIEVPPEGVNFTVNTPYICDHCQDKAKEAFPFGVYDRNGKHWDDLCNDCFDELGCSYPAEFDDC